MSDNELENRPAPPPASEPSKDAWERSLVQRLVFAANNEQRRARRWGIFFKSLGFIYLFTLLLIYLPKDTTGITVGKHTALVDLQGVIADDAEANADTINAGLRAAFKDKNTAGVILRTRLLTKSETIKLPALSTVTPVGIFSSALTACPPSPLNPAVPLPAIVCI